MEIPESVIPSNVRLYSTDKFLRSHAHSLYFSAMSRRCKFLAGIADREMNMVSRTSTISEDELIGHMVECCTKIMDSVPDGQIDDIGDGIDFTHIKRRVIDFGYTVRLSQNGIGIRVAEVPNERVQVQDVLFGPFDF
jgi:hypothetical protein